MSVETSFDYGDFLRDPVTENWLGTWPILTARLTEIRISQIDMKESRNFQNRAGAHIDDDHVSAIAESLRNPSWTIPPIVVRQLANGRFVVGDGNHRAFAAQRAGRESLAAYVVTCDDKTFHDMTMAANARNAKNLSEAEKATMVARMVARGIPQVEVAAQWGLSTSKVSKIVLAEAGLDSLRQAGVAQPERLTPAATSAAARLDLEDLMEIGASTLKDISGREMQDAAREIIEAKPSERLRVAKRVGEKIRQERQERKTPKARRTRATGMTPKVISNTLRKITLSISEKPDVKQNEDVQSAMQELLKAWK